MLRTTSKFFLQGGSRGSRGSRLAVALQQQRRSFQSKFKPGQKVSCFDSMTSVHEDPRYNLDLKPMEWRDGQVNGWNSIGILAPTIPCMMAVVLMVMALSLSFTYDTESVFFRANPHSFFEIRSGQEQQYCANPMFKWMWPYNGGEGTFHEKNIFLQEIAQAIEQKRESSTSSSSFE